jgi:2-dehydropantoate 2-reductase
MRIAIVGAGAIGAYMGAKLHQAGEDVHLLARGPHLQAMKKNGLRVTSAKGEFIVNPAASDDPYQIGPVDVVFLTVKAHSLPSIAPLLAPLLHQETTVVSAQNGIPWWYFHRNGGPWEGTRLEKLDPLGVVSQAIEARRIVGCVVYPSTVVVNPGVIRHIEGDRFTLGEPDGSRTQRCKNIAGALINAGLRAPISTRIREELWVKLIGSVALNPLSALTRGTLQQITSDPEVNSIARKVMEEVESVVKGLGIKPMVSIERRLIGAQNVGHHKTSMLQDIEAGRPLELESLVGVVVEIGGKLNLPMPYTNCIYACTKLLAQHTTRTARMS